MQVRAHILQLLEGSEPIHDTARPAPDTYLLNELIREYLDFQGYDATKSVFCKESQLSHETFPRSFLEARVGLNSGAQASRLPVLFSLLRRQDRDTRAGALMTE
jgi:hypothetical protein